MMNPQTSATKQTSTEILEKVIAFGNNGINLTGKMFIPADAGKHNRVPGAVLCHGYGSDQAIFEDSARELAAEGIATLTFDFRGHGSSEGELDGSIVDDVMDAWDYLHAQPEVDHRRMGLIGHSMGAFSAILAAGKLRKAKVLVALACPGEINNPIAVNPRHILHPALKWGITMIFKVVQRTHNLKARVNWKKFIGFWPKMKPSKALAELDDCSKLFVFCLGDPAAPYNKFLYSYGMACEPKRVMVYSGNHDTPMEEGMLRSQWQKWTVGALHGRHPY
ncbi:MAG: alpha/beta hydrolase family protein [Dehalococcoidia bacterium]